MVVGMAASVSLLACGCMLGLGYGSFYLFFTAFHMSTAMSTSSKLTGVLLEEEYLAPCQTSQKKLTSDSVLMAVCLFSQHSVHTTCLLTTNNGLKTLK